ncbi:tetratricopeptide repeat protein [Robiginitalea sp.]|jgi:tetratricopeptide (TPR) repeat protein|uniref:tetratricopeptide repeat protein n=1 Tax=Robiginitalea sp. TaxID=1902411 RepID=UPI003C78A8BC
MLRSLLTSDRPLYQVLLFVFLMLGTFLQAQELTSEQWQEDLDYLQKTIHDEYAFLFKKISASDFDGEVGALRAVIPELEDHEVMVGLARLVASFEYGHTVLGYWEEKIPLHELPIVFYQYDDGIFIQGVHRDYAGLAGARLLEIEGMPVERVLELMRPVIPAENEMFVKAYGIHYLTFPEFLHAQKVLSENKRDITLTLEKDGEIRRETITSVPAQRFPRRYGMVVPGEDWVESRDTSVNPLYLKELDRISYYEYLPEEKVLYARQSQIMDDEQADIPTFFKEVFEFIEQNDVDKFILDLRLNGGGNNYKNKPIVTGVIRTEKINKPGKFMVIIGRRTFSACQNLVNELSNYTNAVFVGEPTSENINFYGDNRPVSLPHSGLNAYLSYAWWQDKPQWENGPWLTPHLATGMTFEQYRTNQDPALEAALAFSDSTFILNPMDHLTELFTSGRVDQVKPAAARMISDSNYAFYNFEQAFDKTAHNLLKSKRLEESYFVFSMNAEFFPERAGVWNGMGAIYAKQGEIEKAREAYQKALAIDPEGQEGAEARRRLMEL